MHSDISVGGKTVSGMIWSFLEMFSNQGIQFLIVIILARLLSPEEFGIIGLFGVFIGISQILVESGFVNALIKEEHCSQADYSTVFFFNIGLSLVVYLFLVMTSGYFSRFFHQPELQKIFPVIGVVLLFNALSIVHRTILIKKIEFRSIAIVTVTSTVTSGIIAIILAFMGFGVWSLVIRSVILNVIQATMFFIYSHWKPSFVFSIKSFKRLFGFGWKLLMSTLIDTIYRNIYFVIIGKYYPAAELGYYTNASKLRDASAQTLTASIVKVSFPALSSIQSDAERLKAGFIKVLRNTAYLTFPVMFGLASASDSLIPVLLGAKWEPSVIFFQLLCLVGVMYPMNALNMNMLQVKGRSDLFLRLELVEKTIGILSIVVILLFGGGIVELLMVGIVNSVLFYFICSSIASSLISYNVWGQIKDILPALLLSITMGIVVHFVGVYYPGGIMGSLVLEIVAGVAVYIGFSLLFKIKEFYSTFDLIKVIFGKLIAKRLHQK